MKKIYALLLVLLPLWAMATSWEEKRQVIYPGKTDCQLGPLFPGHSLSRQVKFQITDLPAKRFLRVTGGVAIPAPYHRRGETNFRATEFWIDDHLDSLTTEKDHYSLYFEGDNEAFERHAYYRLPGNELEAGKLKVVLPVVKKKELTLAAKGDFGLQLHLYYKKEGRADNDLYDAPDSILHLPIPEGNGGYEEVKKTFVLPEDVACILLQLGGTYFRGECWVEAPRLIQKRKVVREIPFARHETRKDSQNGWVGCNLSSRSWPAWKLEFDGKTIFEGKIFDRASNVADFYIPLPQNLPERGEMKLSLLKKESPAAYAYKLRSLEIIEEPARDFEVISLPRYVTQYQPFGILVETNRPNVSLKVTVARGDSTLVQQYGFGPAGLQVVQLRAGKAGGPLPVVLEDGQRQEQVAVQQVVEKTADDIYISSGDEIYIDKQYELYDYFFKWYLSQRIGNGYQFRPSYQWSGVRIADRAFVRHYTGLLNRLQMPYAWQVEGRTLAGSRINPTLEDLQTPMFRGKQAHENDGGYYYWQHFTYQGLYSDLAARNRPYGGIFAKHRPLYTDHGTFIHYDPQKVKDMADGAQYLVDNLRYSKGESTRHTGPSTLFRYLYQAGYDWLGAEQMYGPEETILSSLRGASRAYGRQQYGTLHAMQWGSYPFTDPKHALRLYQSLAVAYMHGSSHLNTEEALWTDEYLNDRYTEAGKAHLSAQHQMLDFVETHTRRGELTSHIAVVQGRNDAWKSFGRGNLWSQKGPKWKFDAACASFDLLKVFYPGNEMDCCGPDGWFSPTPYGPVDLLPIEAPLEVMDRYKVMIFLGWNNYDPNDFSRIREFVQKGGTLLLTAAHINAELQPDQVVAFPKDDAAIRELLGGDYQQIQEKTIIPCGKGKVIYFPQRAYPSEPEIREAYAAEMRQLGEEAVRNERQRGWIETAENVGFTVWDTAERRTLYLLDTDWKSGAPSQKAVLTYGNQKFNVNVRPYHIETIHCAAGLAVMPSENTTDILDIQPTTRGWKVRFQTTGGDALQCMQGESGKTTTLRTDQAGIFEREVERN